MASSHNAGLPQVEPTSLDPSTGYPRLPEGWTWNQFPPAPDFYGDPEWYDTTGRSLLEQRQIFSLPSADEQVAQILSLLHDFPGRGLDMMFAAAVKGNAFVIRALLDAGVKGHPEADAGDDMSCVPLHAAAANDNLECLQVLLEESGVNVNALDDLGGTALMRASWKRRPRIVKFLLEEKNADPTIRQTSDVDALEFAAGGGSLEIVKILLDHSPEGGGQDQRVMSGSNPTTGVSVTPLALAGGADSGNVELVEFLLENGGYPSGLEEGNWMGEKISPEQKEAIEGAVERAAAHPHIGVLNLLLPYLTTAPSSGGVQTLNLSPKLVEVFINGLFSAVTKDDVEGLEFNWNFVLHPDLQSEKQQIANELLHRAAQQGSLSSTRLLVEKHNANVNFLDKVFTTPLYVAAVGNHVAVMEYMLETLEGKINLHESNGIWANGPTALAIAAERGNTEVVKLLLRRGGPVEKNLADTVLKVLEDGGEDGHLQVSVKNGYRFPVTLQWVGTGDIVEERKGTDEKRLVIEVTRSDLDWLRKLQIRKTDEVLLLNGNGRPLKTE